VRIISASPGWLTPTIAVLGLMLALISLDWQVTTFYWSGSRVRLHLQLAHGDSIDDQQGRNTRGRAAAPLGTTCSVYCRARARQRHGSVPRERSGPTRRLVRIWPVIELGNGKNIQGEPVKLPTIDEDTDGPGTAQ
jgi:hypothetical protein